MKVADIVMERAATERGASKYVSQRTGDVFYISHREDGSMVYCDARHAATSPFEPLRERAGRVDCTLEDSPFEAGRNGVRCIVWKAAVQPRFQRQGVYDAMLDHLEQHGYIVYGASGEIGNKVLQAQSADAKAFWQHRRIRVNPVKLVPASEQEVWGHGRFNPFAYAETVMGIPVIDQFAVHGQQYPLLVLWQKNFSRGRQQVGVVYDPERGYKVGVSIADPRWGEEVDTFFRTDGELRFYYGWMSKVIKPSTVAMIHKIGRLIANQ